MNATDVIFPRMDQGMTTGVLAGWLVSQGEIVSKGEPIATIETEKVVVELESPADGILGSFRFEAGDEVAVGAVLATIDLSGPRPNGEPPVGVETPSSEGKTPPPGGSSHEPKVFPSSTGAQTNAPVSSRGRVGMELITTPLPIDRSSWTRPHAKTPRVRAHNPAGSLDPIPVNNTPATHSQMSRHPISSIQKAVIRAITLSASIPQFQVSIEVSMRAGLDLVGEVRESSAGSKVSLTDLLLKATALAVSAAPFVNASFRDDAVEVYSEINVNLLTAVGIDLFNPAVRGPHLIKLSELATERERLTDAARARTLSPSDVEGGTITLSNLGMTSVDHFSALLYPPQAAIVAVSRARRTKKRAPAWISISVDHRVVNGAQAADFADAIRARLENPISLLTE